MKAPAHDWAQVLGFDRLPNHIVDKRVTDLMDLRGKKAIVAGAGGDGLGQAIANRLGGCGADIALVGRTFEKVRRRAKEVEQRADHRCGRRTVDGLTDAERG